MKSIIGVNDTSTVFPEIKEYWDYEKNGFGPERCVGKKSNQKVWLKCKKGHSFYMAIYSFYERRRCPICSNKKVLIGFNDLATTHCDLAKEWNYDKNGNLTPQMITYGSDKKVWWICKKGHEWSATINSRASGNGCPICNKEYQTSIVEKTFYYYLSLYFNDIEENAHLSFLGKRELDIYIPSLKLAVEYDGYRWHRDIDKDLIKDNLCKQNDINLIRIREEGCPVYNSSAYFVSSPRNHGSIVGIESTINLLFELINRIYSINLPLVTNATEDIAKINELFFSRIKNNSLLNKNPEPVKEWNYEKNNDLTPELVSVNSNMKVWWKCSKGHEWLASVAHRNDGRKCPICSNKKVLVGYNDLQTLKPTIAAQWDLEKNNGLLPTEVTIGSNKKIWWKCDKNHSWITTVASRLQGYGCPYCSGMYFEKGVNDLETLFPDIEKEWNYEKNLGLKPSDISAGSEKKVWWICKNGHSYQSSPRSRTVIKTGCNICCNLRVLEGYNDLKTLHPELAKEWNYEKNGELLPTKVGGGGGSHKKVWWKCSKGHEWEATLASRINLHTGCPHCYREKRKSK